MICRLLFIVATLFAFDPWIAWAQDGRPSTASDGASLQHLVVNPHTQDLWGWNDGWYVSMDRGETWNDRGGPGGGVPAFGRTGFIVAGCGRSFDYGFSWDEMDICPTQTVIDPVTGNLVGAHRGDLYVSRDYGSTWILIDTYGAEDLAAAPDGAIVRVGDADGPGLWISTSGGETWDRISTAIQAVDIFFDRHGVGYMIGSRNRTRMLFTSESSGRKWNPQGTLNHCPVSRILGVSGSAILMSSSNQLLEFVIGNWGCFALYWADDSITEAAMATSGTIYLQDGSRRLLRSTDGGDNWEALTRTASSTESMVPFSIGAALYPNPLLDAGRVDLNLNETSLVHAAIFDVLGREVRRLDERLMPAGSHRLSIDASGLIRGLYFLRIQTPSQTTSVTFVRQ